MNKIIAIANCLMLCAAYQPKNERISRSNTMPRPNDSIEYVSHAIQFIQSIKKNELTNKSFILDDAPTDLDGFDCLKKAVGDRMTFTETEVKFIANSSYKSYITRWTK